MGAFDVGLVKSTIRQTTLNADIVMLTNGTFNNVTATKVAQTLPDWQQRLALYNIGVEHRGIASFSRLHGNDSDVDDDFVITFTDGGSIVRNAILANWPAEQASNIPVQMDLNLTAGDGGDIYVAVDGHMQSNVSGVFVVGDANS